MVSSTWRASRAKVHQRSHPTAIARTFLKARGIMSAAALSSAVLPDVMGGQSSPTAHPATSDSMPTRNPGKNRIQSGHLQLGGQDAVEKLTRSKAAFGKGSAAISWRRTSRLDDCKDSRKRGSMSLPPPTSRQFNRERRRGPQDDEWSHWGAAAGILTQRGDVLPRS